ncbi:MAG: Hpt domain-containing protein, partial [Bryobacteraceae bacterium]
MIGDHKQAFLEEARELLVEMEAALLELDRDRDDAEAVGRAFRALHTIKGSGAMFGFDDISGFAHDLETAFDRVRDGQLAATVDLINLALAAGDQIKGMLDRAAGHGTVDERRSAGILADLRRLTGLPEPQPEHAPAPPVAAGAADSGPAREWQIRFRPAPEAMLNGTNPLLLIRDLRELGELEIHADTSAIPPLAGMDPERCYLAWDATLTTTAALDAIRDVFIFVENDCELAIEPVSGPAAAAREPEVSEDKPSAPEARKAAAAQASASLRVSAGRLDDLVNLVGELVTVQARLSEIAARRDDPEILSVSEEIDRLTSELRENSMRIRMLPIRGTFERFRRLVHDLGAELRKGVELTVEGADTELDKTVIDQLNDPLVHLIRNSMDHGIET